MRYLRWQTSSIKADSSLPSLEELQCIFSRQRLIPIGWLFPVAKRAAEGRAEVPCFFTFSAEAEDCQGCLFRLTGVTAREEYSQQRHVGKAAAA